MRLTPSPAASYNIFPMLSRLTFLLRLALSIVGALALLYTLSYPDSILPPSPDWAYVPGFKVYDLKPILFLGPLLFMELVSSCGLRRNLVWFSALGGVLLAAVLAWPVLLAYAPEWVRPTLPFEDGKLAVGVQYYAVILAGSFVFRRVLLAYLFREPRSDEDDPAALDPAILDPSTGKTVREIAANPIRVAPRFRFGEADHGLIARFYALMRRLARLRSYKHILMLAAALAVACWFFFFPQPTEQQALARDLVAMYEHVPLPGGGFRATRRAVHAAYRVLRHVSDHELFAGMSLPQAQQWLQVSRAPAPYRRQLLDSADISLPSVDDIFESRTRFFTVQDGRRIVVLYVRTDETGKRINISEVQDAGWNSLMDDRRRRFGSDVSAGFFSR